MMSGRDGAEAVATDDWTELVTIAANIITPTVRRDASRLTTAA
jgi:hypothetical protein